MTEWNDPSTIPNDRKVLVSLYYANSNKHEVDIVSWNGMCFDSHCFILQNAEITGWVDIPKLPKIHSRVKSNG